MEEVWDHLVKETKKFVHDAGFSQVVIGISGGIDSAVTACLACTALGPENVLGLAMPSVHSSLSSVTDAKTLAQNLNFELITTGPTITSLVDQADGHLRSYLPSSFPRNVTHENLQARMRAVLLMAVCNEQDRLLLNTCNKSEDMVGYCTLYGDSCGATAPIGSLYKTQVYKLARWINNHVDLPSIPANILTKEPSAELSDGQLDSNDLPPYDLLDPILVFLETGDKYAPPELVSAIEDYGDNELLDKISALIRKSEFKRAQSPLPIQLPSYLWYVGFEEQLLFSMVLGNDDPFK